MRIFYYVGTNLASDADISIERSRNVRLASQEMMLSGLARRMMWTMELDREALELIENRTYRSRFSTIRQVCARKPDETDADNYPQVTDYQSVVPENYFRSPRDTSVMPFLVDISPLVPHGVPTKGIITSHFGTRTDPVFEGTAFHRGIDIANSAGTPVWATADGVVAFAGRKRYYGNVVILDHPSSGYTTVYAHLRRIQVRKGATVSRLTRIGTMGSTGKSTGPHLHYEVRFHTQAVNPLEFMMPPDVVVN
ncbi:MAG: M23 family metallopeptidase [Chitinispirillaceae bacterium]